MIEVRSSIDLGTNTCLLLIVEWDTEGQCIRSVIRDEATVVRLGEGVDQARRFQEVAMERVLWCLQDYAETLALAGGDPQLTRCVATSSARDASNAAEFFAKVQSKFGFQFQTLSGQEEAKLTFLGALLPGISPEQAVVIDIGGGSTELTAWSGGLSVDLGSVRFTERFFQKPLSMQQQQQRQQLQQPQPQGNLSGAAGGAVTDAAFWACQDAIDAALTPFESWCAQQKGPLQWVGVAGTVTTLAAWYLGLSEFDAVRVDQVTLTVGDVHRCVEDLKWRTPEERRKLPGMDPLRADVILAGALILWRLMERLRLPEIRVSSRGLRYGVLAAGAK